MNTTVQLADVHMYGESARPMLPRDIWRDSRLSLGRFELTALLVRHIADVHRRTNRINQFVSLYGTESFIPHAPPPCSHV